MRLWLSLIALMQISLAQALEIPKGLDVSDRKEVVRIIGLNSANKMLSNPYPLGGYSGYEFGYSMEFISVRDMRRLGCEPGSLGCPNTSESDETELRYSRFTIGKGLYNDVDVFFSFIPPTGGVQITDYGALARWSFYQAKFLPINLSALVHFDQLNFADSFVNRNLGAELMVGVNVDNFAVYFGGGMIQAQGTFIGYTGSGTCLEDCTAESSNEEVNTNSRTVTDTVQETHTVVGISAHYENLFTAAQVDRYRDAVYSLKIGLRF
jgi:hypothetical protein